MNINTTYFDWYPGSSLSGIQYGDIVAFSAHAAYVVGTSQNINDITVDQVPYEGGPEQVGKTLYEVIYTQGQGQPTGYFRKKPIWSIKVQNGFTGGKVGVGGQEFDSPFILNNLYWESTVSIDAVMDGRTYENYVRRFQSWSKDVSSTSLPKSATVVIDQYDWTQPIVYTANFNKEFNIAFQNSLPGVGSGGVIKVNGAQYNSPTSAFAVVEPNTITGEALYQVINRIEYTFSSWSPGGSTSASTVFTPSDHTTYTANFNAKPLPPANVAAGGAVGEPVHITWTEHPHPSVTQYQIWRIIKPLGGSQGDPQLLETVNRGTTSFTDYSCVITESYTHDLVSYDVRAYFSVNGSYSDPNYVSVFANSVPPARVEDQRASKVVVPKEYTISAYPNPFNPSTTFSYQLTQPASVRLRLFDVLGREVKLLVDSHKPAGYHAVVWNGQDQSGHALPSGMYLYHFSASSPDGGELFRRSGKLLLTK